MPLLNFMMKLIQHIFLILLLPLVSHAQVQALFNSRTQLRNMTERWELDTTTTRGTFLITPYKPVYVLPVRWSSAPNDQPHSGSSSPELIVPEGTNFNNIEVKFQLSFKTKILQGIFWKSADVWVGYTQKSHWQLYNNGLSRPFREINYEPELILNVPLKFKVLGFNARMAGVAFNHESNGKSNPFSRSWNRIIFHAGFERNNWSVYIRPWLRLRAKDDDNPDISKYIGRGDVNVIYTYGEQVFSLMASHNLDFVNKLRGSTTFSWSYPIQGNFKGYLQVSHGYSESLIDYNHSQTTVGVGVSLIEWL